MHPRILAQREADASRRIVAAAVRLGEQLGLGEQAKLLEIQEKRPEVQQLLRNEAVADFLEVAASGAVDLGVSLEELQTTADELVTTTEALLLARIEAIDGIGPKTMEVIRKGLVASAVAVEIAAEDEAPAAAEDETPQHGNVSAALAEDEV